ncbi:DMT family transporter [Undibacterium sp. RTI2.1]|uniref:DMT family transporter n=1 Tax=unclassified Undibacterium TaxID=2630295 RepID=UPI002B22BCAD|nr:MULTISPECIES: DMT family transporter [unclassified Undibacterium]MEB0032181.1 DMT family transporter [Undibacterium sp. RTI2.1]MEB0118255.1 DMT family transporter [Undibacterium sp. RTI2.2]
MSSHSTSSGIKAALLAAILFGAATPLAKTILVNVSPWMLAGLFYLGSGIGLALYRRIIKADKVSLSREEWFWFGGAIIFGGIIAPVLLMTGLTAMPASGASLLLNAEGVFTALLAWFVFKENFDQKIALGMLAIVLGAIILSWPGKADFSALWPSLAILGACFAWAIDNNLTRKVSLNDASWVASVKGLVSGCTNLCLALLAGAHFPSPLLFLSSMMLGFLAYGVSLALFVVALRQLGTARTGAYFAVAPFFGALLALILGEPITVPLVVAGLLMALGIWLHLSETHEHHHIHEELEHEHEHTHDEHHQHRHDFAVSKEATHRHPHRHSRIEHTHSHFPDSHHQHSH